MLKHFRHASDCVVVLVLFFFVQPGAWFSFLGWPTAPPPQETGYSACGGGKTTEAGAGQFRLAGVTHTPRVAANQPRRWISIKAQPAGAPALEMNNYVFGWALVYSKLLLTWGRRRWKKGGEGQVLVYWNVPRPSFPCGGRNALKFVRKFKRIKGLWKIASICVVCIGLALPLIREKKNSGQPT